MSIQSVDEKLSKRELPLASPLCMLIKDLRNTTSPLCMLISDYFPVWAIFWKQEF